MSDMEILLRFNRVYGKFYSRKTGYKLYRANLGDKFSRVAFKRANDAIAYKSKAALRYMNLNIAYKEWLKEQNKPTVSTR